MTSSHTNTTVGKYLVSPLTKVLDDGRFAASVSIRSGSGSGTHHRHAASSDAYCMAA